METKGNEYQIEQPNRGAKNILWLALGLIAVALLVAVIYYFTKINKPTSAESHPVEFVVTKGESSKQIANHLSAGKVISSTWVFLAYTTLNHAGGKIEAGQYLLDRNMSITEIVDVLTHGRVVSSERNLTTIEGWTNNQIAMYLVSRQIITKDVQFADTLQQGIYNFKFTDIAKPFNYQGFLFPDTYKVSSSETVDSLAQKMLTNFQSKITDQMLSDITAKKRNLKDVMILASIIEKEVGRNKDVLTQDDLNAMQVERTNVASVFYNRLEIGMSLESDATVNYVTGKADRSATIADTKIKSPYNTYQITGLPPGPISNPGLGSIMAAIYPANTDYVYFLNKTDGEAVFAKTLAQHNANKAKYLK